MLSAPRCHFPSHEFPHAITPELLRASYTGNSKARVSGLRLNCHHQTAEGGSAGLAGRASVLASPNTSAKSLFQKCSSRREEALNNRRMVSSQRNQILLTSAATIHGIFQTRSKTCRGLGSRGRLPPRGAYSGSATSGRRGLPARRKFLSAQLRPRPARGCASRR
jgi:hypothetical protein